MKRPELKELLDADKFEDFLIWYYILREVGYTVKDFDECVDTLMKENPITKGVIDVIKPYIIDAMNELMEKENEN